MNVDPRLALVVDALEAAADGVVITDRDGRSEWINSAFIEASGYSRSEAIGRRPGDLVQSGKQGPEFYRGLWQTILAGRVWRGEIVNRRKDGQRRTELMTVSPLRGQSGAITHFIAIKQDITEQRRLQGEIETLTWQDPVTGLANRRHAVERLNEIMAACGPAGHGAVLHLDLDDFSAVNDTLGHDCGDRLLQQTTERLLPCLAPGDFLAHVGGDDFLVIAPALGEQPRLAADTAMAKANALLQTLAMPFPLDGTTHHLAASIGIALFDGAHDHNSGDLLKQAEIAMYHAKRTQGRSVRIYKGQMRQELESRVATVGAIREALARREFVAFYQAQVDREGRVVGAEVLARWRHPRQGLVSPDDFVPAAEQAGLIDELGDQIVRAVCGDLARWDQGMRMAGLPVAVNISPLQMRRPGFSEHLRGLVTGAGIEPQRLTLEVTEGVLVGDISQAIRTMAQLRRDGFRLALDDFGTGYASLAYLKRLPLDVLKIDKSFVIDMLHDPENAAIIRMILALAEAMDLEVMAEGVETEEIRTALVAINCHRFQGYLFGRPMPADEFETHLENSVRR